MKNIIKNKNLYILGSLKNAYIKLHNALYKYTNSRYAVPILIIVSFTESSFFIIPPDVLLVPMVFAMPKKAWIYAIITTISSVLGGIFGYVIGLFAYEYILESFIIAMNYQQYFQTFQSFYDKYGLTAIFIAGFTPIPYKIATIASGVFQINIWAFIGMSLLSRGLRFFLLAWIIHFYHNKGKNYLQRYFKLIIYISSIIIILLFLIYLLIK